MESAQTMLVVAMAGCAAALVVGALYVLAVRVRDECALHDLTVEARRLRVKRARRRAMLDDEDDDVLIVGDADEGDVEILADAA